MSSSPAPRNEPDPAWRRVMANAMLEAAHDSLEAAEEQCRRRDDLIAQLPPTVRNQIFWWRTERFEAKLEVFYRQAEQIDIVACRAVEIDYERPTAKRRIDVEHRFITALDEYGSLRDEVISKLVG